MELPRLEPLWQKYNEKGLSVIAIEARRDRERSVKFIEESKLTYHLLENDEATDVVRDLYGVRAFPTSFVVDGDGKIMYYHLGFEEGDETQIEREIVELGGF